jgi:hypothetical protein
MPNASWWDQLKNSFDWSGVSTAMPEDVGKNKILDPLVNAGMSMATLPQRAYESSKDMVQTGVYDPAPMVEAATLPMGTGAIAGVPLRAGEAALGAGILRPTKPPPLVGVLHGTGAPVDFPVPTAPPKTHDLGVHVTVDPTATDWYTKVKGKPGEKDFYTGRDFGDPTNAGPRTVPLLGDFRSALKYPADAVKWNNPDTVITALENHMRSGFVTPRGLLSDMYNISSSPKTWQDQFIPMLKDRGYDSLLYPHGSEGGPKFNTFMSFDPEKQLMNRLSPEGQAAIAERGVVNPLARDREFDFNNDKFITSMWKLPKGVLAKPSEIESLVTNPKKNTFKWWEEGDTSSPLLKELHSNQSNPYDPKALAAYKTLDEALPPLKGPLDKHATNVQELQAGIEQSKKILEAKLEEAAAHKKAWNAGQIESPTYADLVNKVWNQTDEEVLAKLAKKNGVK